MMLKVTIICLLLLLPATTLAEGGVSRQQWEQITAIDSPKSPEIVEPAAGTDNTETDTDSPFGVGESPAENESEVAVDNQAHPQGDNSDTLPAAKTISAISTEAAPAIKAPEENFTTEVLLQGLNKITARTSKLEVKLGEPIKFGNLSITLLACWKSPPEEAPESKALLEMWEEIPGEARRKIFSGWMFASSPMLSAPQHPVYDITVLQCAGEPLKISTTPAQEATPPAPTQLPQ